MALATVGDLIARARTLLQDKTEGAYRYPDADLISGLNEAFMEAKRLRPDLFLRTYDTSDIPAYTTLNDPLTRIPEEYRPSFIYYVVGNAQLQDQEENIDARATTLLNKFVAQLLSIPS